MTATSYKSSDDVLLAVSVIAGVKREGSIPCSQHSEATLDF